MALRMRYGKESEFDPSKMVVGEWAVSTDARYVRMCFAPGVVLRMATYEGFEADMAKIQAILAECKNIQTAIERIQSEVNSKAVLCAEYAESAKKSADAAAESAEQAKMYAENASAVTNVQIATKDIAGLVKGGDNHIAEDGTLVLTDRTDSGLLQPSHAGGIRLHSISAVEDRQDGTTGKNRLVNTATSQTISGIKFTVNKNKSVTLNGSASEAIAFYLGEAFELDAGSYILSGGHGDYYDASTGYFLYIEDMAQFSDDSQNPTFTLTEKKSGRARITVRKGAVLNNVTFYPMIRDASIEDDTYEPYTGGKPSPAPGEPVVTSANQLKLNGTTQTVNGATVTFDMANQFVYFVGDPTADAEFTVGTAKLGAGTWYANAICQPVANTIFEYSVTDSNGNILLDVEAQTDDVNVSEAFTLTEPQTVTFKFKVPSGESIDQEFMFAIVADSDFDWDEYTVKYTEGYPQAIEGTVMKNLLPKTTSRELSGVSFTVNENGSIYVKGTSTANRSFDFANLKLPKGKYISSIVVFRKNNSGVTTETIQPDTVFSVADDTEYLVPIIWINNGTAYDMTVYPMIRPASILDDTYVPYGCLRVVGRTAQLLNATLPTTSSNGITCTANGDGAYTLNGTATENVEFTFISSVPNIAGRFYNVRKLAGNYTGTINHYCYDNKYLYGNRSSLGTAFPMFDDVEYTIFRASVLAGTVCDNLVIGFMVSLNADDAWQPYIVDDVILSKPFSAFHNIGGVSDKLTADAEVRRFATVVFDGSEEWVLEQNMFTHPLSVQAKAYKSALCDKFICAFSYNDCNWTDGSFAVSDKYLRVNASGIDFVDEWKAYLAQHPMTVVYELATEQVTPLPTADQIALHSLKSYDGVTHLYTDTYPPMVIDCEWGTSKVGAVAFDGYNAGRRAEIRAEANYNELASALLALNQE